MSRWRELAANTAATRNDGFVFIEVTCPDPICCAGAWPLDVAASISDATDELLSSFLGAYEPISTRDSEPG